MNFSLISLSLLNIIISFSFVLPYSSFLALFFSLTLFHTIFACKLVLVRSKFARPDRGLFGYPEKSYNMISGWIRIVQFSDIRRSLI